MLAARETLAAQDLRCTRETLGVLRVRLLVGAVFDCAQIVGHQQVGVGSEDAEGEFQWVEEDMKRIHEAGHFCAEVLGFETSLQAHIIEWSL